MPRVTDLQFWMEDKLKEKLDMMVERMTGDNRRDNLVLIDGDEGDGKSTMAAGVAYYIHHETGRPLSLKNLFFNLDELMTFALNTKEQIIVWDEGALGGLAGDWWNKHQKKFLKLLMVARKRRHFFIICIPKFFKMNEYLVLDRSIALIHVYARNQIQQGKFIYFNKVMKEKLYYDWRKSRYRNYRKYYNFHGSFPNVFSKVFDEAEYDKKKDLAIMSIDKEDDKLDERSLRKNIVIKAIAGMMLLGKDFKTDELSKIFGMSDRTIYRMKADAKKLTLPERHIINSMGKDQILDGGPEGEQGNNIVKHTGHWEGDRYVFPKEEEDGEDTAD